MSILAIILVSVYVASILFKFGCDIGLSIWIIRILNSDTGLEKLAEKAKDKSEKYKKEKELRSGLVNILIALCPILNVVAGIKMIIERDTYLGQLILLFCRMN